jgi:hypothetical protein
MVDGIPVSSFIMFPLFLFTEISPRRLPHKRQWISQPTRQGFTTHVNTLDVVMGGKGVKTW